jgi:hypothetical protein
MSMLKRSVSLVALSALLGAASAHAQGTNAFHWYVGGHGGVLSFRTSTQNRNVIPTAGGDILITAKRTGLLLSVDQAFGSNETTQTQFQQVHIDTIAHLVAAGPVNWTFKGVRKYSATLIAYPVRNKNIQPFVGIGAGIMHATSTSPGPFADQSVESHLSSFGFGSALAGLEFRLGPLSAFGQYQVTTKGGFHQISTVMGTDGTGKVTDRRDDYGQWFQGAMHTLVGGLRFDLGRARD